MVNIQTETDIGTDRLTEREGQTVSAEQELGWGGGGQGLTGQVREQEQNQEKVTGGEMRWRWTFPSVFPSLSLPPPPMFPSYPPPLPQMAST